MVSRLFGLAWMSAVAACAAAQILSTPVSARDGSGGGSSGSSGQGGGNGNGNGSSGTSGSGGGSGNGSGGGSANSGRSSGGGEQGSGRGGDAGAPSSSGRDARQADDGPDGSPPQEHDLAREAVLRGTALPLATLLQTVRTAHPGDVLDVRLRRLRSGAMAYDVTVLAANGEVRAILVDAQRNRIIETRQR